MVCIGHCVLIRNSNGCIDWYARDFSYMLCYITPFFKTLILKVIEDPHEFMRYTTSSVEDLWLRSKKFEALQGRWCWRSQTMSVANVDSGAPFETNQGCIKEDHSMAMKCFQTPHWGLCMCRMACEILFPFYWLIWCLGQLVFFFPSSSKGNWWCIPA